MLLLSLCPSSSSCAKYIIGNVTKDEYKLRFNAINKLQKDRESINVNTTDEINNIINEYITKLTPPISCEIGSTCLKRSSRTKNNLNIVGLIKPIKVVVIV